ncbi:MAG: hypothetical protein M3H12_18670 [Chromatiales bacterium]|nr:hypothetical protein [Gammaproteobacteria bacterium]
MDTEERLKIALKALEKIRRAGQNFDPPSIWMQKWAAYGMEPEKWPKPDDAPPKSEL